MNTNRLINIAIRFVMRQMSKGQSVDPTFAKATMASRMARRLGKF